MAPKGVAESGLGWDASTKVTPMPIPSRGGGQASAALHWDRYWCTTRNGEPTANDEG